MTPEELKEFREWCRTFEVSADSMIMKALTHIDQQATALDEAEALIKKNAEQINALLAQVAALQEIAGEERVRLIARCVFDCPEGGCLVDEERISETVESVGGDLKEQARRQLSEEHPEAFR